MPETFSENMNNRYDNLNIRFQHMQHKKQMPPATFLSAGGI